MRVVWIPLGLACAIATSGAIGAQEPIGRTLRVTGTGSAAGIEAQRLQLRDADEDPAKGQLSGSIEGLDQVAMRFRIGPVVVRWRLDTHFRDIAAHDLADGKSVRVSIRLEQGELVAISIQPATAMPTGTLQITGVVTPDEARPEGGFRVLGQQVRSDHPGYNRLDSLTQRQDSRRPDHPLGFDLFGRRATVTGEYDLTLRDRDNLRLDGRSHVRDLDHELKLELFYPLAASTWLFVSGKFVYESEILRVGGSTTSDRYLARDQTWLYLDRIGGTGLSLQAGRLNLAEPREWWWDDDLDAVRLLHDSGPWHTEWVVAREMLRERSDEPDIDPAKEKVTRWAARTSWLWASRQTLEVFALHADDRSATPEVGATLPAWAEDESDARLIWIGLRALGDRALGDFGDLRYWADVAWLRGRERLTDYDEDDGISTVDSVDSTRVRAAAYDAGLSWETRLPLHPSLTVGRAWGSGDGDGHDGIDRNFRQTGLHNNKWRYHGVNRFRYYGELLRPELSNLTIDTLGVGLGLGRARSLDLVYHRYRQDKAARALRDARVSGTLDGLHTDVGREYDLILGSREWSRVDVALAGSMFRAGSAYGAKAGRRAYQALLEITVNF